MGPIIGGLGTVFGPLIGALALHFLGDFARAIAGRVPGVDLALFGVMLILAVGLARDGLRGLGPVASKGRASIPPDVMRPVAALRLWRGTQPLDHSRPARIPAGWPAGRCRVQKAMVGRKGLGWEDKGRGGGEGG